MVNEGGEQNKRLLESFKQNRKMYNGLQSRVQNSMMEIEDRQKSKSWKEYGEEYRREKEKERKEE